MDNATRVVFGFSGGLARNFGRGGSRGGSMGGRGARNSTNVAASGGTSVASGGYHDSCQYVSLASVRHIQLSFIVFINSVACRGGCNGPGHPRG